MKMSVTISAIDKIAVACSSILEKNWDLPSAEVVNIEIAFEILLPGIRDPPEGTEPGETSGGISFAWATLFIDEGL